MKLQESSSTVNPVRARRVRNRKGLEARRASSTNVFHWKALAAVAAAHFGYKLLTGLFRGHIGSAGGQRPAGGGGRKVALVWFRNDLRIHDNEALDTANKDCTSIVPVYCFDPREYGKSPSGFHKTGPYRAKFIMESVADLRKRLRELGTELIVRVGKPEEVIPKLVRQLQVTNVLCHGEVTQDECDVEKRVKAAVEGQGAEMQTFWGGTLYHMQDLPFPLSAMPTCYGDFKTKLGALNVRPAAELPLQLKGFPVGMELPPGDMPSLRQLGLTEEGPVAARAGSRDMGSDLHGGESAALAHLTHFLRSLKHGGSMGGSSLQSNFSGRISPWLSVGCLSPRHMYHSLRQELGAAMQMDTTAAAGANGAAATSPATSSASPLSSGPGGGLGGGRPAKPSEASLVMFELLWRDFFRFITLKYAAAAIPAVKGAAATQQVAVATA